MKIIFYIIGGIIGIYLLLVIPQGIGVLISEIKFKRSPFRKPILEIIEKYKKEIDGLDEASIKKLCQNPKRESLHENDIDYSVDISAKERRKKKAYEIIISVGVLKPITFGHAKRFYVDPKTA